ncbi:MAG: hypothetical protein ACTFAK_14440 [Candidatus Electronema sp. VV]
MWRLTQQQYEKIADSFPRQRGDVTIDNLTMLNAAAHILEHAGEGLQTVSGNRRSIRARMSRWSTVIKVHPDETNGPQSVGRSCGGWTAKPHLTAARIR